MPESPQVGHDPFGRRIGGAVRGRARRALQGADTELRGVHVEQFRQADGAMGVQLERFGAQLQDLLLGLR